MNVLSDIIMNSTPYLMGVGIVYYHYNCLFHFDTLFVEAFFEA